MFNGVKKHIIFDWDGTLIDSLPMWANADKYLLESLGKIPREKISQEREKFIHSNNSGEIYLKYNQYLIDTYHIEGLSPEDLNQKRCEIIETESKLIDLKPMADVFLKMSKDNGLTLTLATITDRNQLNYYAAKNENIKRKTDHFRMFNGGILTKDEVVHKKPNPEVYIKALKKAGFSREETVVIEDSLIGVTAAKSAGIDTIAIYDPYNDLDREAISKLVDYEVLDYFELAKKMFF